MEGRTIIPVASVRFGFGAGGGPDKRAGLENGEAGGGGGGMQATPAGVLVVTASGTRFIRFHAWQPLMIAAAAGFVVGLLAGRRR
jgi:uncharacterized spore protein YtfJ